MIKIETKNLLGFELISVSGKTDPNKKVIVPMAAQ
jgi:hypothetical protein